jgi:hypothetical protein
MYKEALRMKFQEHSYYEDKSDEMMQKIVYWHVLQFLVFHLILLGSINEGIIFSIHGGKLTSYIILIETPQRM